MMNEKDMVDIFVASTPIEETNIEPHNYITLQRACMSMNLRCFFDPTRSSQRQVFTQLCRDCHLAGNNCKMLFIWHILVSEIQKYEQCASWSLWKIPSALIKTLGKTQQWSRMWMSKVKEVSRKEMRSILRTEKWAGVCEGTGKEGSRQ